MKSMTAYTSVNTVINGTPICFEIKSYNGRYLDLKVNLPFWLSGLEPFVREYFTSKISATFAVSPSSKARTASSLASREIKGEILRMHS